MANLYEIESFLDRELRALDFDDASFNGLQVAAGPVEVERVATGVTASAALIAAAIEQDAQLILTHHGLFWRGQSPAIRGGMAKRVAPLITNGVSLAAYHLPIDAHPELGNNAVMARKLGLSNPQPWGRYHGASIGQAGDITPAPVEQVIARIEEMVEKPSLHLGGGPNEVRRVAIVSGGGASLALQAARQGFDLFLTGEPTEQCMHIAEEESIHIVAAGHHNTETFGVQAVGDMLAEHLGVDVRHIDIPNPV
jgi:dinuclear metal center YbgI/SA1388 family protein